MGARDLSVIQTPPPNRYPIQTEVHTFNEEVIVDAINFEMSRNGQVFLVNNSKEEEQAVKAMNGQEYVVQQCCSDLGRDVRVYIIGNKIIKAVLRTSTESFKSNYSLGGKVQEYTLNNEEKAMVERIVDKLPLDYAGIDFTFNNGKAVFNEIEDAVGARMLYQVSDIDIVEMYIKYILEQLSKE